MKKTKDQTEDNPASQQLLPSITPAFIGISEAAFQLTPNEALVLAVNHCSNVAAEKFNPHFKSKYFGLSDLLAEVKPVFMKYGLTILQTPYTTETRIALKTEVLHHTGHRFDFGELAVKSEGTNLQQLGSITTYLRRYSISTLAGISGDTDLDDDGNAASHKPYPAQAYAKPVHKTQPEGKASTQTWWLGIGIDTVAKVKAAESILWKKGWLTEGELLEFLPDDKVLVLTGNPKMTQAFMEAVNNG